MLWLALLLLWPYPAAGDDFLACRAGSWERLRRRVSLRKATHAEAEAEAKKAPRGDCLLGHFALSLLSETAASVAEAVAGLLSGHFWSELLLSRWSLVVLRLASEKLTRRGGLGVRSAKLSVRLRARARQLVATAEPQKGLLAFVRGVDQDQRAYLASPRREKQLRGVLQSLRGAALLLAKGGRQSTQSAWWMPTAGWSQAWIVLACFDESLMLFSCAPIIKEATRSPLLSRQRFFLSVRPEGFTAFQHGCGRTSFPFVTLTVKKGHVDRWVDWTLGHYQDVMAAAVSAAAPPELVVFVDVQSEEDPLSQLWDLERWLLHSRGPHPWDLAWVLDDGVAGAALLACEEDRAARLPSVVPKAGMILMKPQQASLDLLRDLRFLDKIHHFAGASPVASIWGTVLVQQSRHGMGDWFKTHAKDSAWPWWRRVILPAGVVQCLGASQLSAAARPQSAEASRGASAGPRWALRRCEKFSTGTGYCALNPQKPRGFAYLTDNCGFPSNYSPGRRVNADGQEERIVVSLKQSQEFFLCPRRVPLAVLAVPRAGSVSVANWMATMDGLDAWAQAAGDVMAAPEEGLQLWASEPLCLRCCTGVGRLQVIVMRSPFQRLRAHFDRAQISRGGAWLDFPGWLDWSLDQLRRSATPTCVYSVNHSNYEWSVSDEHHLRPASGILAKAGLEMKDLEPLAQVPSCRSQLGDASHEARLAPLRRTPLLAVLRLERLSSDIEVSDVGGLQRDGEEELQQLARGSPREKVQQLLCCRFAHCQRLPQVPRVHVTKETQRGVAWPSKAARAAVAVYAQDLWLGKYPRKPSGKPQAGYSVLVALALSALAVAGTMTWQWMPQGFVRSKLWVRVAPPRCDAMDAEQVPESSHFALEERVLHLEVELQRSREELEACSVLVLSLDNVGPSAPAVSPNTSPFAPEEASRLKARVDVLEEAWALRSTTVGQRAEESVARVEEEVKKLWRELLSKERGPKDVQSEARAIEELRSRIEKTQSQVAELHSLRPEDVDALMKKMIDEVSRSVKLLGDRCSKLEGGLAAVEAAESSGQAEKRRTEQLEKMVELLLQQRRQDLQEAQANFREIDARFHDWDQKEQLEKNWRPEAEAIRAEMQEMRSTHLPSLFQQHMKAMKAMQEGLTAVRAEVKKLGEMVEVAQKSHTPPDEDETYKQREVLALKAQVGDLQEQVTQLVIRGLEERFATLRADVAREVTAAVRETKENWSAASRRISALEAWPASQAELTAEVRGLLAEHREDRGRLEILGRQADSLGRQVVSLRRELALPDKAPEKEEGPPAESGGLFGLFSTEAPAAAAERTRRASEAERPAAVKSAVKLTASMASSRSPRSRRKSPDPEAEARSSTPRRGSQTSTAPGFPVVIGPKLEWALSPKSLQASKNGTGALLTGELEVAGIFCRLKFFPDGSPSRQTVGSCSRSPRLVPDVYGAQRQRAVPAFCRHQVLAGAGGEHCQGRPRPRKARLVPPEGCAKRGRQRGRGR
ncbi:unnamed protein product [Effrenium voratum]|uniref:Uncharacterized protein n=1 Tax=Effrenium voratum TaxID=2562239 RepID=A0AA36JPB1_9DINO|nr:unnamed protein product [Effrenium voratum]